MVFKKSFLLILSKIYEFGWKALLSVYPDVEAKSLIKRILEDRYGVSQVDLLVRGESEFKETDRFMGDVEKLVKSIPIQHILGREQFYDRDFVVTKDVLIPRPETQTLIDLVKKYVGERKASILDIGTGSGAIAVSLSCELENAVVSAVDISPEALKVAIENAKTNRAKVTFLQDDILNPKIDYANFDVIVSNPPYVMNCEKEVMRGNVLDYEPQLALFVEDSDPLIFYREITNFAIKQLNENGALFFEINEKFGEEVGEILYQNGFVNVTIEKDFKDKNRFVWGIRKR